MIKFNKLKTFILVHLIALTSCGQDYSGKTRSLASIGEEFGVEINLLDSQSESIALRICNALRSKRSYWHSTPIIGKKANLSLSLKSCSKDSYSYDIETTIASTYLSNPIILDSLNTAFYYKEVITEAHGPLTTVCPSLFSGDNPLEFYSENGDRVYTEFSNIDTASDRLVLKYAELNSNDQQEASGYKVYKTQIYDIVTTSEDATFLGTASLISAEEACEDDSVTSTTVQKLNSIL